MGAGTVWTERGASELLHRADDGGEPLPGLGPVPGYRESLEPQELLGQHAGLLTRSAGRQTSKMCGQV